MKMYKYVVYVSDFEGYGPDEYKTVMLQHRHLPAAEVFTKGEIEIDEDEYDDHELNQRTATEKTYDKYFKGIPEPVTAGPNEICGACGSTNINGLDYVKFFKDIHTPVKLCNLCAATSNSGYLLLPKKDKEG